MSDQAFRFGTIGNLILLAPLHAQLRETGAVEAARPSLILVGATTIPDAEQLLLNLSPRLRRRTVLVGLDEHLDLELVPGSHAALLERTQVLGSLPSDCTGPTITSFIGPRGEVAQLVGARSWKLGSATHKVWCQLPAISTGAFLRRLLEAVEVDGSWLEAPPVRRRWSYV